MATADREDPLMTPIERVQRLRDQLATATPAPWEWLGSNMLENPGTNGPRYGEVISLSVSCGSYCYGGSGVLEMADEDRALIVRLRNAAETQLDLLQIVFERHHWTLGPEACADYRAALAVLDALDPEGAD